MGSNKNTDRLGMILEGLSKLTVDTWRSRSELFPHTKASSDKQFQRRVLTRLTSMGIILQQEAELLPSGKRSGFKLKEGENQVLSDPIELSRICWHDEPTIEQPPELSMEAETETAPAPAAVVPGESSSVNPLDTIFIEYSGVGRISLREVLVHNTQSITDIKEQNDSLLRFLGDDCLPSIEKNQNRIEELLKKLEGICEALLKPKEQG